MTSSAPILATTTYHDRVPMVFMAEGGLNYNKGNSSPYFTLTYTAHRKGFPEQRYSGGADHKEILRRFPQLADLAALHLSDIEGVPMHAIENGFYFYDKQGVTLAAYSPPFTPQTLADHLRVTLDEAKTLLGQHMNKAQFTAYVESCKPRWKAEAEACIAKHSLVIFGDHYAA